MKARLGVAVAGFPNLFLLGGPNTGLGHNSVVFMLEAQIGHILRFEVFFQTFGSRPTRVSSRTLTSGSGFLSRHAAG